MALTFLSSFAPATGRARLLRNEYLAAENRVLRAQFKGRKLIASKFDGSKFGNSRGRPRVDEETERLAVRMAKENPGWGYDRIVGAMANLGLRL
jgi:hypothetical protein